MGWSTRLFLIRPDGSMHRLPSTAFSRMLRADAPCRAPDFAGERVKLATATVELAAGVALGLRHLSFSVVEFGEQGAMNVARLNAQQVARFDAMWHLSFPEEAAPSPTQVVAAASRFTARGDTWEPDEPLRRHIEAAALGRVRCTRVHITG
jgi:hypothetical protein